jgi:hypothetical protein
MTRWNCCAIRLVALALILVTVDSPAANINWTGAPGGSWGTGSNWSNGSGPAPADIALRLGASNTLLLGEFHIGKDYTYGQVDIVNNATFNLGSPTQRTALEIANQNTNTNATYSGVLDLKNAAVNLHFDSVLVAQKNGGPGGTVGQLLGGGSGSAAIGDPAARGNFVVANTVNGGRTQGTVDFGRLSTLTAHVNDFWVGRGGGANGNVTLVGGQGGSIDIGAPGNTASFAPRPNSPIIPFIKPTAY